MWLQKLNGGRWDLKSLLLGLSEANITIMSFNSVQIIKGNLTVIQAKQYMHPCSSFPFQVV